ncbi:hypothetical protein Droror1_Dr00019734 [Drosera rotundifolia]
MDTGSDLIWTQCSPCIWCYNKPTPTFNPADSSSFSRLSCSNELCQVVPNSFCLFDCFYSYSYADGGFTDGYLANETFTSGVGSGNATSVPNIGFGCGFIDQGNGFSQGTFALSPDGSGGVIVDSGTTFFYLAADGYDVVSQEVAKQIELEQVEAEYEMGLNPCWEIPESEYQYPTMTLHFNGADLVLPGENYLVDEPALGVICLAVLPSNGLSIFGDIPQQNHFVQFDLVKETFSLVQTSCSGL